jgi:hypothetical protein
MKLQLKHWREDHMICYSVLRKKRTTFCISVFFHLAASGLWSYLWIQVAPILVRIPSVNVESQPEKSVPSFSLPRAKAKIKRTINFIVRPRFNDPSYQWLYLATPKQHWPSMTVSTFSLKIISPQSNVHQRACTCELCFTTKMFLAAFARFDDWSWNDPSTMLHFSARAEGCYATRRGARIIKSPLHCSDFILKAEETQKLFSNLIVIF